jgi:ADP-heptose:LPS heptosyltransferase
MDIKNRNLFRINRIFFLRLPWLFRFFSKFRKSQKRLLIIKTDAIGDYVIFRNFIEAVKTSALYNDHKIDLLGNILWKDLAVSYDDAFVDEFIFVRTNDYYNSPLETLRLGWRLFKKNYSLVLQPTYSRKLINDSFAALTGSSRIMGFEGDSISIPARYKVKTDKFYKERFTLPQNIHFEFERSKFFFESILQEKLNINSLFIPVE